MHFIRVYYGIQKLISLVLGLLTDQDFDCWLIGFYNRLKNRLVHFTSRFSRLLPAQLVLSNPVKSANTTYSNKNKYLIVNIYKQIPGLGYFYGGTTHKHYKLTLLATAILFIGVVSLQVSSNLT
jgi:hypothetical protein